jgi:hypothetical protein
VIGEMTIANRNLKKDWTRRAPRPNQLWQADVTYIHIPGCGWRCAVTVIDYDSRVPSPPHSRHCSLWQAVHTPAIASNHFADSCTFVLTILQRG